MDKSIITKLVEILEYYKSTYTVESSTDEILSDLLTNGVEVNGNSFYCPMWSEDVNGWILLAGTKDKADMWVMKKIIRLIKTGRPVYSMLNGNSEYLLGILSRYNVNLISEDNGLSYISFNTKE